jgi:acyl carrier protein
MTDLSSVKYKLNRVFRDVFEDDNIEIFDTMTAADIDEWDSVTHITLVLAVEKEFGVRLNAAEVGKLDNVGEMIKLLARRSAKQQQANDKQ